MTITREQVADAIVTACNTNPTKTNPIGFDVETEKSACLYNDGHNNRCIAGEVIFVLTGINIPSDNFCGVWGLIVDEESRHRPLEPDMFHRAALELLAMAQQTADNSLSSDDGFDSPNPLEWGDVLTDLRSRDIIG